MVVPTVLLPARDAAAQPAEDPVATEARKRFLEGVKLYDAKKYEQARVSFAQAYALKKHPAVLLNLAQAELNSGHALDAAQHFKDYLKEVPKDDAKRGEAERGLSDARTKLGRIQVSVDLGDADVLIDGAKVGASPLGEPVDVAPGAHTVEVKKGDQSDKKSVTAGEGKTVMADFTFSKGPAAPAGAKKPDDKKPDDKKPDDATPTAKREPVMTWAKRSPISYAGVGLAGVGLGLGVSFTIARTVANNNANDVTASIKKQISAEAAAGNAIAKANQTTPCSGGGVNTGVNGTNYARACSQLRSNLDTRDTDTTIATVGWIMTGVGVATFVGGYFLTAKKTEPSTTSWGVVPVVGNGVHGIGALGTF